MRIEQQTDTIHHKVHRLNLRDGSTSEKKTSAVIVTRRFERSDVAVNKPDISGFRSPSPYQGVVLSYNPPSVETVVTNYNLGVPLLEERLNEVAYSFNKIFGEVYAKPADWENSLKSQALRSIKDQKVNLSMTLAFLPETLKMIRGRFSTIGSVLTSAKSGDWKMVGRLLKVNPKSTSSFYLEVLFGWLQLIRDTQGIVEELHRKCNKPTYTYVYGRAKRSQDINPIVKFSEPYHWKMPGRYEFRGDRKIDHRLVMIYRGETKLLSRFSQLGLLNPLELMWDLVPWSWVVNMGVSIGDFLSTLDATVGLTYLGGTYTRYSSVKGPVTVSEPDNGVYWKTTSFSSSPGFYEETRFNRKVIDEKIDPFVLKNPFSAPIALTTAVIAAVVQKGKKAIPQPPAGSTRFVYKSRRVKHLRPIPYRP